MQDQSPEQMKQWEILLEAKEFLALELSETLPSVWKDKYICDAVMAFDRFTEYKYNHACDSLRDTISEKINNAFCFESYLRGTQPRLKFDTSKPEDFKMIQLMRLGFLTKLAEELKEKDL